MTNKNSSDDLFGIVLGSTFFICLAFIPDLMAIIYRIQNPDAKWYRPFLDPSQAIIIIIICNLPLLCLMLVFLMVYLCIRKKRAESSEIDV